MDCLIYLREDCSYRAVRLNSLTTILLHPEDDRPVGVKLKGMHYLYNKLWTILKATKDQRDRLSGVHLVAFWELALTGDGQEAIASAEQEWRRQLAKRTRKEIIESAGDIADEELQLEAA
jgi:hypothetical protein